MPSSFLARFGSGTLINSTGTASNPLHPSSRENSATNIQQPSAKTGRRIYPWTRKAKGEQSGVHSTVGPHKLIARESTGLEQNAEKPNFAPHQMQVDQFKATWARRVAENISLPLLRGAARGRGPVPLTEKEVAMIRDFATPSEQSLLDAAVSHDLNNDGGVIEAIRANPYIMIECMVRSFRGIDPAYWENTENSKWALNAFDHLLIKDARKDKTSPLDENRAQFVCEVARADLKSRVMGSHFPEATLREEFSKLAHLPNFNPLLLEDKKSCDEKADHFLQALSGGTDQNLGIQLLELQGQVSASLSELDKLSSEKHPYAFLTLVRNLKLPPELLKELGTRDLSVLVYAPKLIQPEFFERLKLHPRTREAILLAAISQTQASSLVTRSDGERLAGSNTGAPSNYVNSHGIVATRHRLLDRHQRVFNSWTETMGKVKSAIKEVRQSHTKEHLGMAIEDLKRVANSLEGNQYLAGKGLIDLNQFEEALDAMSVALDALNAGAEAAVRSQQPSQLHEDVIATQPLPVFKDALEAVQYDTKLAKDAMGPAADNAAFEAIHGAMRAAKVAEKMLEDMIPQVP